MTAIQPDTAVTTALEALKVATQALERATPPRRVDEPLPRWLRAKEVAAILGLSVQHVYSLMASGKLPTVRVSRSVRVPEDQLRAYMATQLAEQSIPTPISQPTQSARHRRSPRLVKLIP